MRSHSQVAWEELTAEATAIVDEASRQGVTLRVMGSAGIRLHCRPPGRLMDALGRPAKDIDLVVPHEHRKQMRRFFEAWGYVTDRDVLIAMEGTRYSFTHSMRGTQIDVFVERLNFCHTIDVRQRLRRHPITLPVEELMLAKLQIVQMTMTDAMDVAIILGTHRVRRVNSELQASDTGPFDPEAIDGMHIASLLARDWGFHHTATMNLRRIGDLVGHPGVIDLGPEPNVRVADGVARLLGLIVAAPKSVAWRMRDMVGERKQWWQDVDEKEATY